MLTVIGFDSVSAQGVPVTITAQGELVYDPRGVLNLQALKPGESVQDTFTYTLADLAAATSTATVTVTVHGRNDVPAADNDRYEVSEDALLSVDAPGVWMATPILTAIRFWRSHKFPEPIRRCCRGVGGWQLHLRSADIARTPGLAGRQYRR